MSPAQVKILRAQLELTQAEFAKALGVVRLTVSQYETGFRRPRGTVLILLRVLASLSMAKAHELVALLQSCAEEPKPKQTRRRA